MLIFTGSAFGQNLLDGPESVVWDEANHRYLVGNYNDGNIIAVDTLGNQEYFVQVSANTVGLLIIGDTLFAATNYAGLSGIAGYSLADASLLVWITVTGASLLNGLESDTSGHLVVTGYNTGTVYRIDRATGTATQIHSGLTWPNGLAYDAENDRMLMLYTDAGTGYIGEIDVMTGTLTHIVASGMGDGLDIDCRGYTYFSSWATDRVYRFDENFTFPPTVISKSHTDPADFSIRRDRDLMAVPNFNANRLDIRSILDTDMDGIADDIDNCPDELNPLQEDANGNGIGDVCDGCCGEFRSGMTGNTDCSTDGNANLSDITRLIDRVYISKVELCCEENGNTDGDLEGRINLSDITALIDHVYISKGETAACA